MFKQLQRAQRDYVTRMQNYNGMGEGPLEMQGEMHIRASRESRRSYPMLFKC